MPFWEKILSHNLIVKYKYKYQTELRNKPDPFRVFDIFLKLS